MTRDEYVEMIEWVEDRWGVSNVWRSAVRLYPDFEALNTDQVYEVLLARRDGDPEKARYAPKPGELRALTLERMRHTPPPPRDAIPETTSASPYPGQSGISLIGSLVRPCSSGGGVAWLA